jgi:hypothetical protein
LNSSKALLICTSLCFSEGLRNFDAADLGAFKIPS